MSEKWLNNVATINESKAGKLYIKIDEDFEVKKGDTLVLKKKADEIDESVTAGKISSERGEELKQTLHFIKYSVHKPPRQTS